MAPSLFLLYVGSRSTEALSVDDKSISLEYVSSPMEAAGLSRRPDIVVMDPFSSEASAGSKTATEWIKAFNENSFRFQPAVFVVVPSDSETDICLKLLELGYDQTIEWPLSVREIRIKAAGYLKQNHLEQSLFSKTASLEKSFEYLDRFKNDLREIKDELLEDRNNLNAALKQIQQMTSERKRLKANLSDVKGLLASNMEGFGRILHTLIKQKVEQNRGHGERVARIARFVAKEMGLGEKKLEDLTKAAMLHEVGLLFLSDGLLEGFPGDGAKEDGANDEPSAYDKTLMVQFPVKGADLLNQCPGFEGPAKIIRSMNENSDGTGYPEGLKKNHIPVASRILAGADELESLRERADMTGSTELLAGLEEFAGGRLDPVIVGWLEKYVVLQMDRDTVRVRGVGIEQLRPGMELGAALFTTTGTKLFTADTVLTQEAIDKIIQYHREYPVDETVYVKA